MTQMKSALIYQVIAYFLQYPHEEMIEELPALKEEIDTLKEKEIQKSFQTFIAIIERVSFDQWIDHYIACFDFEKTTNLYVTYLKLGEQRERGLELLQLKQFYQAQGFAVTDSELPDYLPLMLEFCANVNKKVSNELLERYGQQIYEIYENLRKIDSWYCELFHALIQTMEENGVSIVVQKREPLPTYEEEREKMKKRISWNLPSAKGGHM